MNCIAGAWFRRARVETAAALVAAACGAPPRPAPLAAPDRCATAPVTIPRDTVVIGIAEPVDTASLHEPLADGARLVLRQLRGSPAAVSCDGASRVPAPYRLAASEGRLVAEPAYDSAARLPVLLFRIVPGADPRELLDRGADLIVTRDRLAIDYAARRPDLEILPLPWDRIYLLIGTAPHAMAGASEASGADARAAEPPFRWDAGPGCPRSAAAPARRSSRIVYPAGDPVARALAARSVAIGAAGTVAAVPAAVLDSAVSAGSDAGYLVPVAIRADAPCAGLPTLPSDFSIVPLVETRARAIFRRGTLRLTTDADGGVRIAPPGPP